MASLPDLWPDSAELVIVGGGIIGAATAFYAARAGLRPLIVERKGGLGQLTTAASAASFRAQFTDAATIALMQESIGTFERFGEALGRPGYDIGLRQPGYLFVTDRDDQVAGLQARVARQHALGLTDVEFLSGVEARQRFPYLSAAVRGATYRARDGWLDAGAVTRGFAEASGAPVLLATTVTRIDLDLREGQVHGVVTDRGAIATPVVVIAAGPFSEQVAASAGIALPLTLLRRHTITIAPNPAIPADAPMTIDAATGAHWRPHGRGGALAAWSQVEAPGPPQDPVPPDPGFPALVLGGIARLSPFWQEVGPRLQPADLTLTAGQYTMTPDHHPLIGPVPGVVGLYLNTGYSGHGVMASPGGARLLAELLTGQRADTGNPFSPSRFTGAEPAATAESLVL